jgi:hypothetical protein
MATPHEVLTALPEPLKTVGDFASYGAIAATLIGWLPNIAAALSILWLFWQMYDRIKYGPKVRRKAGRRDGD